MRRARHESRDSVRPAIVSLPDVEPGLREEPDGDPLIEQMVDRLRTQLSDLVALDEWGRPVAWRTVVRVALGPTLARLRDAETSAELARRIIQLPSDVVPRAASPVAEEQRAPSAGACLGWPETSPARVSAHRASRVGDGKGRRGEDGGYITSVPREEPS